MNYELGVVGPWMGFQPATKEGPLALAVAVAHPLRQRFDLNRI
jgi:hypothetical protein